MMIPRGRGPSSFGLCTARHLPRNTRISLIVVVVIVVLRDRQLRLRLCLHLGLRLCLRRWRELACFLAPDTNLLHNPRWSIGRGGLLPRLLPSALDHGPPVSLSNHAHWGE